MFGKDDNTYNELKANSVQKWLEEMLDHEDSGVRSGVKVTKSYIEDLMHKIQVLESKNALKDKYLKKLKTDSK